MHFDLLDDVRTDAVCTRVLTYSIRKIETQKKENLKGKIPEKLTNRNWPQRIDGKNHLTSIPISVHSSTRFWTQFDMAKIEVSPENWLKSTFPQGFTFPILDRNLDFWQVNSIIWVKNSRIFPILAQKSKYA